ncbi:MAG: tetratricopeptide repeat protein [Planctomycetota bacterium]|jgi:Tol biopolymer transport system component
MKTHTQPTNKEKGKRANMKFQSVLVVVFALMLVLASSGYAQQKAGRLLQSGLYQEQVKGDLDEAIKVYERIIVNFPKNRPIVAKALLHIGLCYEKMGKQEAQKAYRRLIKEYADQHEPVQTAREHLEQLNAGAPGAKANGPTYRLAFDAQIAGMRVVRRDFSPSGDRIVFISQNKDKLYISDQTATVIRPLLDDLGPWEGVGWPRWSPDGRLIAYKLSRGLPGDSDAEAVWAIFVVDPDGGTPRQIGPDVRQRIAGPFWAHDSQHLSYWSKAGLHTLTLDGNEVRLIPKKDLPGVGRWQLRYSPNGRWLVSSLGKENGSGRDICIFPVAGGTIRRLTHLPGANGQAIWAPDGRTLYFDSGKDGTQNIWKLSMDPKTGLAKGKPQQVTFFKDTNIFGLKVLGDGSRIAFSMLKGSTSIQVADASSPHESRSLVRSGQYSPELSPDGKTVYYVNDKPGEEGIYAVPRQGGAPRQLTESLPETGYPHLPLDLSPDGRTLAYCAKLGNEQGLFTLPASGGKSDLLVKIADMVTLDAEWSPDGSQLAYADGNDLYVIPATGGKPREVAHLDSGWDNCIRWSPDGKFIAALGCVNRTATGWNNAVYVVPASGGKVRQLTPDVEYWDSPYKQRLEWHPDGKRLTYHVSQYESETRQVYLDGRPPSLLLNAPDIWDYEGIWAPDGRRFFFTDNDNMYVYDEASGKTTPVTDSLADVGVPCFSRDGKTMAWWATRRSLQTWIMENFLPKSTASE